MVRVKTGVGLGGGGDFQGKCLAPKCICAFWYSGGTDDHNIRTVVDSVVVARSVTVHVRQRLGGQGPPHGQRAPVVDVVTGVADVRVWTGKVAPVIQRRLADDGVPASAAADRPGVCPLVVVRQRRGASGDATPVRRVRYVGRRDQHGSTEPGRRADHNSHHRITPLYITYRMIHRRWGPVYRRPFRSQLC